MHFKRVMGAAAVMLVAAAQSSCNVGKAPQPTTDVKAIYTFAAQTMSAGLARQQTETAQAASPTPVGSPTPLASPAPLATFSIATGSVPFGTPFGTPFTLPTVALGGTGQPVATRSSSFPVGCNDAAFLSETKPLDKSEVTAGKAFTKGWSLENTGTCAWDAGYSFAFESGEQMDGKDIVIADKADFTDPGHSQTFIVKLTAPDTAGEYKGFWQMKAPDGTRFGSLVYVDIVVP
jgi:Ig-like domain from next to BRCA1 gene